MKTVTNRRVDQSVEGIGRQVDGIGGNFEPRRLSETLNISPGRAQAVVSLLMPPQGFVGRRAVPESSFRLLFDRVAVLRFRLEWRGKRLVGSTERRRNTSGSL